MSYKLLWKFVKVASQAETIEQEVQKIEQDAFNANFENQVYRGNRVAEEAYKKGYVDGVKWCLKRFS